MTFTGLLDKENDKKYQFLPNLYQDIFNGLCKKQGRESNEINFSTFLALLPLTSVAAEDEHIDKDKSYIEQIACEHAFKLAAVFGSRDKAINYLKNFEKKNQRHPVTQFIHDACLFSLPTGNLSLWQKLVVLHFPNSPNDQIMRLLPISDKIEEEFKNKSQTLSRKTPLKKLIESCQNICYDRAASHPEAANLFFKLGLSQKAFDTYLGLEPVDNYEYVPDVTVKGEELSEKHKNFVIKRLPSNDPRAAVLGKYTSCCQHLDGEGEMPVKHGITNSYGGFYVLMDEKNDIIAQTWAWFTKKERTDKHGVLVFDSIESHIDIRKQYEAVIVEMFIALANKLIQSEKKILSVLVGYGGNTPNNFFNLRPEKNFVPLGYVYYRDSLSQRYVADRHMPLSKMFDKMLNNNQLLSSLFPRIPYSMLWEFHSAYELFTHNGKVEEFLSYIDNEEIPLLNTIKRWNTLFPNRPYSYCNNLSDRNFEEIESLLRMGCSLNARKSEYSEVTLAAECRAWKIVRLLIESGANINVRIHDHSLLTYAIREKQNELVNFMMSNGADLQDNLNSNGQPLLWALKTDNLELADLLINKGVCSNMKLSVSEFVDTLILDYCGEDLLKTLDFLFSYKQFPPHELKPDNRISALHRAIRFPFESESYFVSEDHHIQLVDMLLQKTLLVNAKGPDGITPLCLAVQACLPKLIVLLLQYNASINLADNNGDTPLHYACITGKLEIVKLLIEHGASLRSLNNKGQTPQQIAEESGWLQASSYLRRNYPDTSLSNESQYGFFNKMPDFVDPALNKNIELK